LIESTCNQVNQFGGYTGMTPADFIASINQLADEVGLPRQWLILGGDHLGPEVWQAEPAQTAMEKAAILVRDYVAAGYSKIHLDASMRLGDDPPGSLPPAVATRRTAWLAQVSEDAFAARGWGQAPRYVIGTEVPTPGGARKKEPHPSVTEVADAARTLEKLQQAFLARGLDTAWERLIAFVVQPGVEFGDDFILAYDPAQAAGLSDFINGKPLVYEAHSTDYQSRTSLSRMVVDHFAILKVGPALTYAYREAILALVAMENELFSPGRRSELVAVLEEVMVTQPEHWQNHYHGDFQAQRLARKYSFSDRVRYYWSQRAVQEALALLFNNLNHKPIPLTLISQYLPDQYHRIRDGNLDHCPRAMIQDKIRDVLEDYRAATHP
jgi:D-tagatose-1,6-bisphosphate aldolase subunit GatZ/KbaZ